MARTTNDTPDTPIFQIQDATRAGMHLLIQLYGPSECGKTLTAIYLAYGIARELGGPDAKVGVMDTEGRARMFFDAIPGGFKVGELTRPFSPGRYLSGIDLFLRCGVHALIIDSFSHVWEGLGGVLDQAEENEAKGRKGLAKWNKPKRDYNKMVSALLTTRIPIIFCSRAKQPMLIENAGTKDEKWTPQAWQPIQDKRLRYDMTVSLPMTFQGQYETDAPRFKCPKDLRHLFEGELLTIETGRAIGRWVAGSELINPEHELLRHNARDAASKGTAEMRAYYTSLTDPQRLVLRPMIGDLQSAAKTADEAREADDEAPANQADNNDSAPAGFAVKDATPAPPPAERPADSLAVDLVLDDDGVPYWEETARSMLVVISGITVAAFAGVRGKFIRDNDENLDRMKVADRSAWESVQIGLSDRERELRASAR